MEIKQIKELMEAMKKTGINRLTLKNESFELSLEKENGRYLDNLEESILSERSLKNSISSIPPPPAPLGATPKQEEQIQGSFITSPMVGTFYNASSPTAPAFVKVGDVVEKHTIVGIIEAMKVMNEIKAGIAGTVVEILVNPGDPVEFGTKLFRIV